MADEKHDVQLLPLRTIRSTKGSIVRCQVQQGTTNRIVLEALVYDGKEWKGNLVILTEEELDRVVDQVDKDLGED